jgi:nuclear transport factor 2 (NTF2) superfamily protein
MDTRAAATRWADTWQRSWEARDPEPVVALYATTTRFTSQPFRAVEEGREGVLTYVRDAFAEEADVHATFGRPVVDGDRAAVEWWADLLEDGEPVTLAGTSSLRFDAEGLVIEQRDTWNMAPGRIEPPDGWGV